MSDIRERRKALGWSRAELGRRAFVDVRTLQLLELDLSNDDESRQRVEAALAEAEGSSGDPDADDDGAG